MKVICEEIPFRYEVISQGKAAQLHPSCLGWYEISDSLQNGHFVWKHEQLEMYIFRTTEEAWILNSNTNEEDTAKMFFARGDQVILKRTVIFLL